MRKELEFSIIMLTLVLSSFTIVYKAIPSARATYVEGVITQDTDWTLVDSPIVLSGNVSVNPGTTLTIEPGVNVRFGGSFSLIVKGKLVANGMQDKPILFTSNKVSPSNGDWGTILFKGTEQSLLTHCSIEYGTNGLTVEKGFLDIQDSFVTYNSENGITIKDGEITVKNDEIANNTIAGIQVAGGTRVDVENNDIRSNGDGLALVGSLTGEIIIEQNNVMHNLQSGITLSSDAYDNTYITENNISGNLNGFHVINSTSTYITHNYIFDNSIGIYYEDGNNHEAHFNDIYDNVLGMDVSSTANASATYNYWGRASGPFHASLNPRGEGNPVGGNGTDLDFIFFLSAPFNHANTIPRAVLTTDKDTVTPSQTVTFMGTNSFDEGRVDQYFFNFGDGTDSGWITTSLINHTYPSAFGPLIYTASLSVIDDFNTTSDAAATATALITVLDQSAHALTVSMTLSNETVNCNGNVTVTVHASDDFGDADGAHVALFSLRGGSFSAVSGVTGPDGQFSTTFTAPYVTEISDIRLIARASATGYADGSDHGYLKVLPPLTIQMTAEPVTVKSEEATDITVGVTDALGHPVEDALITLQCDNGSLSSNAGFTDANGSAVFSFVAPLTLTEANVTVAITAAKSGFAEGQIQKTVIVEPKILIVEVTTDPSAVVSEATSSVTALVTYDGHPVSDATVRISTDVAGSVTPANGTTDSNGIASFLFHAVQTTVELNATVTVTATKSGYVDDQDSVEISINPVILDAQVEPGLLSITSGADVTINVYVTANATPVSGAQVTISSNVGNFSTTSGLTDSDGKCGFVFHAPTTTVHLSAVVVANVTKSGYIECGNQTRIDIAPEVVPETGGGLPLITMLLIAVIPIVILVAVIVLIKLKVIIVSTAEDE